MLYSQHLLSLLGREIARHVVNPVSQLERDLFRLCIPGQHPGIFEPGEHFVLRIPGYPRPSLEIEASLDINLTLFEAAQGLQFQRGQSADVAIAIRSLALVHLFNDVSDVLTKAGVTSRGILLRKRGQIMAQGVPGDTARFPPAVKLPLRLQSSVLARVMKQPVRVKVQQVLCAALLSRFEWAVQ